MTPDQEASVAVTPATPAGPWPFLPWLLPALAVLVAPLQVNDLAYQLRAGQLMWLEHAVMRTDRFTYTIAGAPWLNQQWGAQLVLRAWFSPFGWKGLIVLQALLVAGAYGVTYLRGRRAGAVPIVAASATLLACAVAVSVPGALALRPQLLALPLFVASAWIIRERARSPRLLVAVPLLTIVWANVHGSFVLVLALLTIGLIADAVGGSTSLRWTALTFCISLLCPLVTPWGVGTYGYVWRLATDPMIRTVITEWRPIVTQAAAIPFFVACAGGGVALWRRRSRALSLEEALTIILFTGLVLLSARNVVWWSLAMPPTICGALAGWRPGGAWGRTPTRVTVGVIAAAIVVASIRLANSAPSNLLAEAPAGITAWLAQRPATERIFAEWWAPWFEYALPDRPMFTDARVELFPDQIWNDYFDVVDVAPDWRAQLDRWHIDTLVVAAGHHPDLIQALSSDPGWQVGYQDQDGIVFVRR